MNVLLLDSLRRGRPLLVGEQVSLAGDEETPAEGRIASLMRSVRTAYRKLEEKLSYYEKLCSDLRLAQDVRVVHCRATSVDLAEKSFRGFLRKRYRIHSRWFWVDLVLAACGAILMPLPGPNLFFFYPAARALGHYQAKAGAASALRVPWTFEQDPAIDRVQAHLIALEPVVFEIGALEQSYGVVQLGKRLEKLRYR